MIDVLCSSPRSVKNPSFDPTPSTVTKSAHTTLEDEEDEDEGEEEDDEALKMRSQQQLSLPSPVQTEETKSPWGSGRMRSGRKEDDEDQLEEHHVALHRGPFVE